MSRPTSTRLDQAASGIEDDIVRLSDRLAPDASPDRHAIRVLEALLFAASEPIDVPTLRDRMPDEADVEALLLRLQSDYSDRGINLVSVAGRWRFQTAADLSEDLVDVREARRKLSKAALETLAIVAYHQPVTRAESEDVRGVAVSKGTLDVLMELGWVRLRGRRRTPGRPVTYGTTEGFLAHFNLEEIQDLPGREELKSAGLLDPRLPKDFEVPEPRMMDSLETDEDPLEMEPEEGTFFEDFLADDDD